MEAVKPINHRDAAKPIYLVNGRFYRGYFPVVSAAAANLEQRFIDRMSEFADILRKEGRKAETKFAEASKQTLSNLASDLAAADLAATSRQVGGTHYTSLLIQPWDAMEAWMSPEQFKGFLLGNAIKYLARCQKKGGLQDLEKAAHYLDKLIELEEAK